MAFKKILTLIKHDIVIQNELVMILQILLLGIGSEARNEFNL